MNIDYSKLKAIVIDDMEMARTFMRKSLIDIGFNKDKIIVCRGSTEALSYLKSSQYDIDVILCDYNLNTNEPNGQQFLEYLKSHQLISSQTLFYMVTAEANLQMVSAALEYEPDEYIIKPYKPSVLNERMKNSFNIKHILKDINENIDNKNYETAYNLLEQILDNPAFKNQQIKLLSLSGHLLKLQGKYKDSLNIYIKLVKMSTDKKVYKLKIAECFYLLKKYEKAYSILFNLHKDNYRNVKLYDLLTDISLLLNNFSDALYYIENAVLLSPNIAHRQELLGIISSECMNYQTAYKAYYAAYKLQSQTTPDSEDVIGYVVNYSINKYLFLLESEDIKQFGFLKELNRFHKKFKKSSSIIPLIMIETILYHQQNNYKLVNPLIKEIIDYNNEYNLIKFNDIFNDWFSILISNNLFDDINTVLNIVPSYYLSESNFIRIVGLENDANFSLNNFIHLNKKMVNLYHKEDFFRILKVYSYNTHYMHILLKVEQLPTVTSFIFNYCITINKFFSKKTINPSKYQYFLADVFNALNKLEENHKSQEVLTKINNYRKTLKTYYVEKND